MRIRLMLLLAAIAPATTGCSSVLNEPELHISPYLAVYELRGNTKMQSESATPPPALQSNPRQPMRTFGQDRFREDVGIRADLGDGFAGLRADYYKLDMNTSRTGTLEHDWGRLLAGDMVRIYAEMDEIRIGYVEPILDTHTEYRGEDLHLQVGAGGAFASRTMKLRGRNDDNSRQQNAEIDGDALYVALRARATWQRLSLDVEYAFAPEELVLSGNQEDFSQDLEARISYQLPQRDIQIFAGVRYSTLNASGDANGFRYDSELIIDGFQFGVSITL